VLKGTITIIEDTYAVPQLCILLWTWEMKESVLVSIIGGLKLVLHEKAMTEGTPYIAILVVDLDSAIKVFYGLSKGISVYII
jgi:hypothetical protein